jgi:glycerophosphoryl diester phosphodiesterase
MPPLLVIAHRGASGEFPENTLPAFERAIELGADYVGFDVHADRDGRLVVVHETPSAGRSYPSLESVLDLCRGRVGVMVELKRPWRYRKHDVVARTLRLLDPEAVVLSFQRTALEESRRLRPDIRTMQHVGYSTSIRAAAGAWAVGFENSRVTRRGVATAAGLGLETAVYTVNKPERMRELAQLGVGGLFTDFPDLALRTLRPRPAG